MESSTRKGPLVTAVVVGVGVVLLAAAALIGNSEEIGYVDSYDFDPSVHEPGATVVVSKTVREGNEIVGFVLREPEYQVNVAFTIPGEECFSILVSGDLWPPADIRCAEPNPGAGEIAGLGRTIDGATYVNVALIVEQGCYSRAILGEPWPPEAGCSPRAATGGD